MKDAKIKADYYRKARPELIQLRLRMPRDLYDVLREIADKDKRSLNSEILMRLYESLT